MLNPRFILIALLALLAGLCGCPGKDEPAQWQPGGLTQSEHAGGEERGPDRTAEITKAGRAISLFADTPLAASPPDSLALSRDGRTLFARGKDLSKTENSFYIGDFTLGEESLVPGALFISAPDLIVPYVSAAPDGAEALVLSQYQGKRPDGTLRPVRDVIYRVGSGIGGPTGQRSGIPYETVPGIPAGEIETYFFMEPLYSWDGGSVIVPFKDSGLAVVSRQTGTGRYAEYPALKGGVPASGRALGPVPDAGGRRRIWLSQWNIGLQADVCAIHMLDLDSGAWELVAELPWAVYRCAPPADPTQGWLAAGSYGNMETLTGDPAGAGRGGMRIPRLARITPGSAAADLLELYGEPVWHVALDPGGRYAAYMDKRREAIVRLDTEQGAVDFDPRWFTPDDEADVLIGMDGTPVLVWLRDVLVRAEFTEREEFGP